MIRTTTRHAFALAALALFAPAAGACATSGRCTDETLSARSVDDASALPADPRTLVAFDSPAGRALLARNADDADLAPLLASFESQQHRAHCGVASSVILLNAFGRANPTIPAPEVATLVPFLYHTQATFFDNARAAAVVPGERVSEHGMTLDQLAGLLGAYDLHATAVHGADVTVDQFRSRVREDLERAADFVLVNYFRPSIGQEGGGHISPLAAYDAASDRILVLDVARYRYGPVWVATPVLWEATRGIDSDSGLTRGLVEASLGSAPGAPAAPAAPAAAAAPVASR